MTRNLNEDQNLAAWLGDSPEESQPELITEALDRRYERGPDEATAIRAEIALRHALETELSDEVYYDLIPESVFGPLLMAVNQRGIIAFDFGESEDEFVRRISKRTGRPPKRASAYVKTAARQVREYLSGERQRFDLPVDITSLSDFQQSVLLAVRNVPRGEFTTYGELARRIGRPEAARAVGQALGSNPIPLVIPCHRVLAADGSLGGYSGKGGVETKARLLKLEGALL